MQNSMFIHYEEKTKRKNIQKVFNFLVYNIIKGNYACNVVAVCQGHASGQF